MLFGGYDDAHGMGRNDLWELSLPARYQNQSSYKWTEVQAAVKFPRRWNQAILCCDVTRATIFLSTEVGMVIRS